MLDFQKGGGIFMSKLFYLTKSQIKRMKPFFPLSHGAPRVDDRRVLSGIMCVLKNGLMWKDAPKEYGSFKTLYNRFYRWSKLGVFEKIFQELSYNPGKRELAMIDSTHIKVHRTATSLKKKRGAVGKLAGQKEA
jgi:transposase